MKKILLKTMLLLCALVAGSGTMWGDPTVKTGSYTFGNASVSGWTCTPQTTYCGLYYSGKNSACVVSNKSITDFSSVDFSAVSSATVEITVTGITNAGTNSYTVSLVDKDGNAIGTPQTKTNGLANSSNSSSAASSSVTLTPVEGATGYRISCNAKTALAGTSYTLTYTSDTRIATTLTISPSTHTFNLADGSTTTLTATVKAGDTPIDKSVTWTSLDTDIATVNSSTGEVTPIAQGEVTIKATFAGDEDYRGAEATCIVTVNKANTAITLTTNDPTTIDLKPANKANVSLNAAVKATKSDESLVDVVNPTVTWTSSDPTVATVANGVVTGLKVGTTTITASYAGGTNYNVAANQTCEITVEDTRTAVNLETFTATNTTLVIDDTQATSVTNDQSGWTAAYLYSSSNPSVATVAADGTVTAIAKGTAIITATLNVADNDPDYKTGETTSKTLEITVNKPSHTVTFSVNGNTDLTASVEEDQPITFPTAVEETTPGANEFANVINGQTFVGWYTGEYSNASVAPSYVNTASINMGNADITYYAVYADVTPANHDYVVDQLTRATTGVTGTTYTSWSDKIHNSDAKYSGQSAGGYNSIQLRNSTPSGIITTTSGGTLVKITIDWNSNTTNTRYITVYGSNSAYSSSSDLYNNSTAGTNLGKIIQGTSTELEISGSYSYLGLKASEPIYIYWCPLKIFGDFRDNYFIGQPIYWTYK